MTPSVIYDVPPEDAVVTLSAVVEEDIKPQVAKKRRLRVEVSSFDCAAHTVHFATGLERTVVIVNWFVI